MAIQETHSFAARLEAIHEAARERFDRAVGAVRAAIIPFAVCGENAAGIWIKRVDEGAVRDSPLIELLVYRRDFQSINRALHHAGFRWDGGGEPIRFADERTSSKLSCVDLHFSLEKDFSDQLENSPDVDRSELVNGLPVLLLAPLVEMLLARFRTIDRVILADLAGVALIDRSWIDHCAGALAERLRSVLDAFDEDRRWHPISDLPIPCPPPGT